MMMPSLPTLPSPPPVDIGPEAMSTYFRWVPAFPYGPQRWKNPKFDPEDKSPEAKPAFIDYVVDEAFLARIAEYLDDEFAVVFYPPIDRLHAGGGLTYGRIVKYRMTDWGMEAGVVFAKGMERLFDDGYLDSWSPTFRVDWTHPTSKKNYPISLKELSFVTTREFKNLPGAGAHYQNSEQSLAPPKEADVADDKENMEEPEVEAMEEEEEVEVSAAEGDDLGVKIDKLTEVVMMLAKKIDGADEPKELEAGEDYENAEATEIERLTAKVKGLEMRNAEQAVKLAIPTAEASEVKQLAGLIVQNAEQGAITLEYAKKAHAKLPQGDVYNAEVGSPGSSGSGSVHASIVDAAKAAKAEGVAYGTDLMKHLGGQGFEVANAEQSDMNAIKKMFRIPV
jgi:hypothetical protein